MKTEKNHFEPGDLVEYDNITSVMGVMTSSWQTAIVLERSISVTDMREGEMLVTKLLTSCEGERLVPNWCIRLISKEEQDAGK